MHRFVLAAFIGLLSGIAWRSLYDFGWSFVFISFGVTLFLYILFRFRIIGSHGTIYIIVIALFFSLGTARMHTAIPETQSNVITTGGTVLEGRIIQEPDFRDSYTNIVVLDEVSGEKVLVRAQPYEVFSYSDTVHVTGTLERISNFSSEGGRIFNYRGYLAKDGVYYSMSFPKVIVLQQHTSPKEKLFEFKNAYLTSLKRALPEPMAALAGGITVGERRSLGENLTQDFRDTGLIHIVVLSGYNIAIIIIFISALLSFLIPKIRYGVAIVAIALFTVLVGASATVVRAAIMGSIGALGAMAGRSYDALHALVIAGFVMLLWNPYLLLYDPSFQLSFIATLGLLLGVPLLTPYLAVIPDTFALRELTAATITTQIAVLPLLVYMVGEVSLVALIVNLLVLPVLPIAMFVVFLTGVLGMLHSTIALPFGWLAHGLLSYVIQIVEWFAEIPLATVSLPVFPLWVAVLMYLILATAMFHIKKKATR